MLGFIELTKDKRIFIKRVTLLETIKMGWLEVETKVRINDVASLRKKIKKIATLKNKETRIDNYFALQRRFRRHGYPKKSFRIRKKSDGYEVNFKKWLKKYWDSDVVVKQEFEFGLKNKNSVDSLLVLFEDLGFVAWIKKRKNSEIYFHKKDKRILIEIHKVKHLGYFMEIEYKCTQNEMEQAKRKIRATLKELEIDKKDIDNTGYTKMLWEKGIRN